MKGGSFSRRGFPHERWPAAPPGFPAPFETVMCQVAEQLAVPGNQKIKGCLVRRHHGRAGLLLEETFRTFAFPIPLILPRQRPNGVCRSLRRTVFLDQTCGHPIAHLWRDPRWRARFSVERPPETAGGARTRRRASHPDRPRSRHWPSMGSAGAVFWIISSVRRRVR